MDEREKILKENAEEYIEYAEKAVDVLKEDACRIKEMCEE